MQPMRMLAAPLVLAMILNLVVLVPTVDAGPPTIVGQKDIKGIKGTNAMVDVTIKVTSHENATYGIRISDKESVTLKFEIFNHGWSENKTLAPDVTYNFTVELKTKTAAVGQKNPVQYEVYENDVLINSGNFNVTVDVVSTTPPSNITCAGCSFIIPLFIVGGLYLVWVERKPKQLE